MRVDGKVRKVYDTARTPYQRVLAWPDVTDAHKQKLRENYLMLNPVKLQDHVEKHLDHLWQGHAIRHRPE